MIKKFNVEAEHNELILKNSHGDHVIIPAKKREWVKEQIASNNHKSIDELVASLPTMDNYAEDGTVVPTEPDPPVRTPVESLAPLPMKEINLFKVDSPEYRAQEGKGTMAEAVPDAEGNLDSLDMVDPLTDAVVSAPPPDFMRYGSDYEKNNPKAEFIKTNLTPFARSLGNSEANYSSALDAAYERQKSDYITQQIIKNKPMGNMSRADYLNTLSDKEEEYVTRDYNYQPDLWDDAKKGFISLFELNPTQAISNIMNNNSFSLREKQRMIRDQINSPGMAKVMNTLSAFAPLAIPGKMVQATYKDGYTMGDAISGTKNDASLAEDLITDPFNLFGLPGVPEFAAKVIGKGVSRTMDIINDIAEEGSTLKNNFQRGMEVAGKETPLQTPITDKNSLPKAEYEANRDIIGIKAMAADRDANELSQLKKAYNSKLTDDQLRTIFSTDREKLAKRLDSLDADWRLTDAQRKEVQAERARQQSAPNTSETGGGVNVSDDTKTVVSDPDQLPPPTEEFLYNPNGDDIVYVDPADVSLAEDEFHPVDYEGQDVMEYEASRELADEHNAIYLSEIRDDVYDNVMQHNTTTDGAARQAYMERYDALPEDRRRRINSINRSGQDFTDDYLTSELNITQQELEFIHPTARSDSEAGQTLRQQRINERAAERETMEEDMYRQGLYEQNLDTDTMQHNMEVFDSLPIDTRQQVRFWSAPARGDNRMGMTREQFISGYGEEAASLIPESRFNNGSEFNYDTGQFEDINTSPTRTVKTETTTTDENGTRSTSYAAIRGNSTTGYSNRVDKVRGEAVNTAKEAAYDVKRTAQEIVNDPKGSVIRTATDIRDKTLVAANDKSFNLGKTIKTWINSFKNKKSNHDFVKQLPADEAVNNMLGSLFMSSHKNVMKEMSRAFEAVRTADRGNFRATSNMSDCSAPLYFTQAAKMSRQKGVSYAVDGFIELNSLGYLHSAGKSADETAAYINTHLSRLDYQGQQLPAAHVVNGRVMIPNLIIKKGGGPAVAVGLFINAEKEGQEPEKEEIK